MTWKRDHIGDTIATPGQMQRFGIAENFDADRSDPRNAAYLVPLANPQAEQGAEVWADVVYGAIADEPGGFDSAEDSDWCFEQCLINGRKIEYEPEYAAIMGCDIEPSSLEQPRKLLQ